MKDIIHCGLCMVACLSLVLVVTLLWLATGMVLARCRSSSDDDARRLTRRQD